MDCPHQRAFEAGGRMNRFRLGNGVTALLLAVFLVAYGCGDDDIVIPPTGDTTDPLITSGPTGHEITASSAEIRWTTNENSISTLFWAADTTAGWQESVDSSLMTNHSVVINGLAPETEYFFAARSTDASGNVSERSAAGSFETFSTLPTIIIDPWETTVAVGDTLRLAIRILNATDLFGAAFDLGPFPDAVHPDADTLSAGPMLGQSVQTLFLYDPGEDLLEVAITRLSPLAGVDGDGTLAWVRLVATDVGSRVVDFRDGSIALRDPSGSLVLDFDQLVTVESTITVQ